MKSPSGAGISVLADGRQVQEHVQVLEARSRPESAASAPSTTEDCLDPDMAADSPADAAQAESLRLPEVIRHEQSEEHCFSPISAGPGATALDEPSCKSSELSPVALKRGDLEFSPVAVDTAEGPGFDFSGAGGALRQLTRLHSLTPHARREGYQAFPSELQAPTVSPSRRGSRLRSLTPPTQHEAERVKSLVSDDSSDSEVLELVQTTRGRSSTWGPEVHPLTMASLATKLRAGHEVLEAGEPGVRRSSAIL